MIMYVMNGQMMRAPFQFIYTLGHTSRDREIARSIILYNPGLLTSNPMLSMILRGIDSY